MPGPRVNTRWQGGDGSNRPPDPNAAPAPNAPRSGSVDPRAFTRTPTAPAGGKPRGVGSPTETAAMVGMQVARGAFAMWWGMTKAMMRFIFRH